VRSGEHSDAVAAAARKAQSATDALSSTYSSNASEGDKLLAAVKAQRAHTELKDTIHTARVATSPGNNESRETGTPQQNAITWAVADKADETAAEVLKTIDKTSGFVY